MKQVKRTLATVFTAVFVVSMLPSSARAWTTPGDSTPQDHELVCSLDCTVHHSTDAIPASLHTPSGKAGDTQATPPDQPNATNCTNFYVTVYGVEPKNDGTVRNSTLRTQRWSPASSLYTSTIGQPTQNDQGVWTCSVTINGEKLVETTFQEHTAANYRKDAQDMTSKTVLLTYSDKTR